MVSYAPILMALFFKLFYMVTKDITEQTIYYIYFLKDYSREMKIFYCGITVNPKQRFQDHLKRFVASKDPVMEIVAMFYDEELALNYEYYMINKLLESGLELKNKKIKR